MMRATSFAFHAMHLAMLRAASWMVPFPQRAEWCREWTSELWHVRQTCIPVGAFSWTAERELTAFCMGSIQDALCLRRQEPQVPVASASMDGSAWHCVLWLSSVLALCIIIGRFLPGIQSEKEAAQAVLPSGVIVVEAGEYGGGDRATIPLAEYRDWESRQQRFFTNLAFYRTTEERVEAGGLDRGAWQVAQGTENLAGILGATVAPQSADADPSIPRALLNGSIWRRAFHSDPDVIGQEITIAHRRVLIAGIAPAGTWQLPGHADIWVMEGDALLARAPRFAMGHVIGVLSFGTGGDER